MKKNANRWIAFGVLGAMVSGLFGGVTLQPAQAGSKARRNQTIGLGAATGYLLYKRKNKYAIAGAAATAYSYKRYRNAKKREERSRMAWYRSRYGRNWRRYYKPGT